MKALVVFFLAVILFSGEVRAAEKLVLNTGIRDPFTTEDHAGFVDLLLKEAFLRFGLDAEVIVYQASARSLSNANQGIDDGAALRIKGLEKKFPNLIRVPEKLMDNDFVAYSVDHDLTTDDWSVMEPYNIAYILGWQIFENNLADHKFTTRVKDVRQMFALLVSDRADFILYERWQGLWWARDLGITVYAHEPPLAKREMFMYLHKKHAHLVDQVAAALREMKADGKYKEIFDKTLTPLLREK